MLWAWSSDLRSSDLSSRAAPRCLFCAWSSDLRLKCLISTFHSTSLDDVEALEAILGDVALLSFVRGLPCLEVF